MYQIVLIFALLLAACLTSCKKNSSDSTRVLTAEDNHLFSLRMYQQLSGKNGNILFSPYSISNALAMAHAGASGNTALEIENVLCSPDSTNITHPSILLPLSVYDSSLQSARALVLTNSKYYTIRKPYKKRLETYFDAAVFPSDIEAINSWSSQKTMGKIPVILNELSPNTISVLLDVIYCNGKWRFPFDTINTEYAPFFITPDSIRQVAFMNQTLSVSFVENELIKAIQLPYLSDKDAFVTGNGLTMVIVCPVKVDGLLAIESKLTPNFLDTLLRALDTVEWTNLDFSLPKFSITSDLDLYPSLLQMGMQDPFDSAKADFSIMSRHNIWISKMIHRTTIQVSEYGTEASGTTAIKFTSQGSPPPPPLPFQVNQPFLYFIIDNKTKSILFMGRVVDPQF